MHFCSVLKHPCGWITQEGKIELAHSYVAFLIIEILEEMGG